MKAALFLALGVVALAPVARADDDKPFKFAISSEAPYAFAEDAGLPRITAEEVEHSAEFSATWGLLTGSAAYIRTTTGDGGQAGLELAGNCPMLAGFECSLGASYRETPGETLRTYEGSATTESNWFGWKQEWELAVAHEISDVEPDTTASAELTIPVGPFFEIVTLKGAVGAAYSFEKEQGDMTWGVSTDIKVWENAVLNFGYKSHTERLGFSDFEVKRKFVASLKVGF